MKFFLSEVSFTNFGELEDSRWNTEAIIIFSVTFMYSQTFKHSLGRIRKETLCAIVTHGIWATSPTSPSSCVQVHCCSNWFHFHWQYITMAFLFCIFVSHELLNFLLLSTEASSSKNIMVCKCPDSIKGYGFSRLQLF